MHIANLGDRVRVQCARRRRSSPGAESPGAESPGAAQSAKEFEFIVGSRAILRGLSLGVVGMTQGELKCLQLQPQDAYGPVKKRLIREVPRSQFPPHVTLHVGKRLTARLRATGRRHRVRIVQVKPESVMVDGNHPLAGRVVTLEVRVISVDSSANANRSKPQFDAGGES